jgi:hypothetical protein
MEFRQCSLVQKPARTMRPLFLSGSGMKSAACDGPSGMRFLPGPARVLPGPPNTDASEASSTGDPWIGNYDEPTVLFRKGPASGGFRRRPRSRCIRSSRSGRRAGFAPPKTPKCLNHPLDVNNKLKAMAHSPADRPSNDPPNSPNQPRFGVRTRFRC